MGGKVIPKEIQQEVSGIIEEFNKKHFRGRTDSVAYFAEMKGVWKNISRCEAHLYRGYERVGICHFQMDQGTI